MGRPRPVHEEVRRLRNQLNDFTNHHSSESSTTTSTTGGGANSHSLKQCRLAYTRLVELLSEAENRQRLNEEAIPDEDYFEIMGKTTTNTTTGTSSKTMTTTDPNHSNNILLGVDDDDDDDDFPQITRSTASTTTTTTTAAAPTATTTTSRTKTTPLITNHHHQYRGGGGDRMISRSVRTRQRLAISEMWKSLITSAIQCSQQLIIVTTTRNRKRKYNSGCSGSSSTNTATITAANTKFNIEDVKFPFKLLKLCYHYDPIFDDSLLPRPWSPKDTDFLTNRPQVRFTPSRLGKEQSKLLYYFCMQLLTDIDQHREDLRIQMEETTTTAAADDDDVRINTNVIDTDHIDKVEGEVLSMLEFICSKAELIATYYKAIPHVRQIMIRIVQPRIFIVPSTTAIVEQQKIVRYAFKIWYNLFHTCTIDYIGIGLQALIPEAFDIFASWCRSQTYVFDAASAIARENSIHIINTIILLMKNDRDLCIASLQRHGYIILPFLKRMFREYQQKQLNFTAATQASNTSIANVLHDFLLQYILVCQEAGTLQGCLSCDLGDIGTGSLDNETIHMFLDVLIASVISTETSAGSDKQQHDKYRIDVPYKILLEVTVRLLNIAQRNFLVTNEWQALKDPTQTIIDHMEQQPSIDDYYSLPLHENDLWPVCSGAVLSESPFVKYILGPIYKATIPTTSTSLDEPTLLQQALSVGVTTITTMNDSKFVAILHILCASAELFPLGSCWATSTHTSWRTLSAKVESSGSITSTPILPPYDIITMNGCSAFDLATIVNVLGNVLVQFGSPSRYQSTSIQKWSLYTLMRLAISTNEVYHHDSKLRNCKFCSALGNSWKYIWSVIHDKSYRYNKCTMETSDGSVGSLVVQLLTQIIRFSCTDSSEPKSTELHFLIHRQSDVWNLKVFEQFQIQSSCPFILLYTAINQLGINDFGPCSVGSSADHDESWQSRLRRYGNGPRSKLICFCLHFVSQSNEVWTNEEILPAVFSCIAALINGFSIPTCSLLSVAGGLHMPSLINGGDEIDAILTGHNKDDTFPDSAVNQNEYRQQLFDCLWSTRSLDINICIAALCNSDAFSAEVSVVARRLIYFRILRQEWQSKTRNSLIIASECSPFILPLQENLISIASYCCSENSARTTSDASADPILYQLTRRVLLIKSSAVVFLANYMQNSGEQLEYILMEAASLFSETSLFLSSVVIGNKRVRTILTNLIQVVRGLIVVHLERRFDWPAVFIASVSKLYDSCFDLFKACKIIDSCDDIETAIDDEIIHNDSTSRTSLDSDQRDFIWQNNPVRTQQTRSSGMKWFYCSRSIVFLISSLLIELHPVYENIEHITTLLLGINSFGTLKDAEQNVDLLGGLLSIVALTARPYRITTKTDEDESGENDTLVVLILKVIRAIRFSSDPSSMTYMFGFKICSATVAAYDQCKWTDSLTHIEARHMLDCILAEEWRNSPTQRPCFRSKQLLAATLAFHQADANFLSAIDRTFASTFVLPSLSDLIQCIRRQSCLTVVAAMGQLSEDKVVENVRKRLCPLLGDKHVAYRRWYANKMDRDRIEDPISNVAGRIWDDAHLSVCFDTLLCWCAIASTTTMREKQQQILFDIISASVEQPSMEEVCFLAIERIALICGFPNAEVFIASEMRDISLRWIERGWSFYHLPLMICVPSTFKRLMQARYLSAFKSQVTGSDIEVDWGKENFSELAVFDFLKRNAKYFFPQTVISSVKGVTQTAITKEGRRKLLESELFKEYCGAFHGCSYNDDVAIKTLRKLMPMVMADAAHREANVTKNLVLLLKGLLGEKVFNAKCDTCACICFRRAIEIVSELPWNDESGGVENLWVLSTLLELKHDMTAFDMLRSARCTFAELMSFVRFSLDTCQSERQLMSRWRSAENVLRLVIDDGKSICASEALFCIDFLVGRLKFQNQIDIRRSVINFMKEILLLFAKSANLSEHKPTIYKTVFRTLMSFHRQCQTDLIVYCVDLCTQKMNHILFGATFIGASKGNSGANSFWNWLLPVVPETGLSSLALPFSEIWMRCNPNVPASVIEHIVASYDVLALIIQESLSLKMLHLVLGSFCVQPFEVETCYQLSSINPAFSAQLLVSDYMTDQVSIDKLDITNLNSSSENALVLDSTHIQMELGTLEQILRSSRNKNTGETLPYDDKDLILLLLSFCSSSLPEKTRIAASRCLAAIGIMDDMDEDYTIMPTKQVDRLSHAIEQDCLVTFTQACILEAVAASVKVSDSRIALIALDTLKLLMSTVTGQRCAELLSDTPSKENLFFLVSGTKSVNSSDVLLNDREITDLRRMTKESYTENSKEWCWDVSFWIHNTSFTTFEQWISRLVAALLVCCYESKVQHEVLGHEDNFYSACQRLSILNPTVASTIFPSIVMNLLLRDVTDVENNKIDDVLVDTWFGSCNGNTNRKLSRCIHIFLQYLPGGRSPKSVQLIIDLLDLLRRYTQHRFTTSQNHRSNKKRNKEAKQTTISDNTTNDNTTDNTTNGEKCILWHGAPYGTVLQVNGLKLANACISSHRFESAIFYAELFAGARFGGPRHALIAHSHSFPHSSRSISGFCEKKDGNDTMNDDIASYFEILRQCYSALGDDDARCAIEQQESDFNFCEENGAGLIISPMVREPPSLRKLQFLDNIAMRESSNSNSNRKMRMPIISCLDGLGFHGLTETYIRGLCVTGYTGNHCALEEDNFLREKIFECNLYAKQWDDPVYHSTSQSADQVFDPKSVESESLSMENGFNEHLVTALDALKRGNIVASQKYVSRARLCFVDDLSNRGSKTSMFRNINIYIDRLRTLNDLEDYLNRPDSTECVQRILAPVDFVGDFPRNRSSLSDCVRATIMNSIRLNECVWNSVSRSVAEGLEMQFQLHVSGRRHQAAQESLYRLSSVINSTKDPVRYLQLRLLEAKLLEGRNDFNSAIRNAKLIIKNAQESHHDDAYASVLADSLLLCGQWVAKHKVEPASSILSNYLQPAADKALHLQSVQNSVANSKRSTRALLAQGQLVANLFEAVSSRVKGLDWQKGEVGLIEREAECENLRREEANSKSKNQNDQIYRRHLEREIKSTRSQRKSIVGSLEVYRTQAIKSIATALVISGEAGPDDILNYVYRLVGLLFSGEHDWTKSMDEAVNDSVHKIPSFRFVPLVNQLLSRIAANKMVQKTTFQYHLHELIFKVAFDHPYHCLIPLITLSESNIGSKTEINGKAEGASMILSKLISNDPAFRAQLIESYKKLSFAYIHLASADTSEFKQVSSSKISFEKVCKTSSCRLDKCLGSGARKAPYVPCVLTKPPKICPDHEYGNGREDPIGSELIDTFESTFTITDSGVTLPKIVVCIGSGRGRFKQLVKGADDTRQDAVMEQVFGYANKILKLQRHSTSNGIALYHNLRLVTYKIVPLSHAAGVLEWVDHSTPFGDFIIDKIVRNQKGVAARIVGGHSRYFPTEWSTDRCRQLINQVWQEYQEQDGFNNETCDGLHHKKKLRETFDMIYENHSPVFRYFFVEKFLSPETWYASKMRYTRSVAVSSIVGHILGIGDRHMSNILVHNLTGEVIHIDFGIVFEQGKRLRIPEIVPFRLTRNVVDGMGAIGVEGSFTRAAEDTLRVLKENSNGLLTILSAIVSDPLYKWSNRSKRESRRTVIESGKIELLDDNLPDQVYNSIGRDGDENRNEVAAHAISRIHDKLLGYEDGTSGEQQSVESQVQLLTNAAQDLDNLCVMFIGWAPFQ